MKKNPYKMPKNNVTLRALPLALASRFFKCMVCTKLMVNPLVFILRNACNLIRGVLGSARMRAVAPRRRRVRVVLVFINRRSTATSNTPSTR